MNDLDQGLRVLVLDRFQGNPHVFRIEDGTQENKEISKECMKSMAFSAFELVMIVVAGNFLAEGFGLILSTENINIGLQAFPVKFGLP